MGTTGCNIWYVGFFAAFCFSSAVLTHQLVMNLRMCGMWPPTLGTEKRCATGDSIKVRFSIGIVNDTAQSYVAHLDGPCRGLVTMASVPALTPIRPHALPSLPFPSLLRVHPALVASRQNLPDAAAVCLLRCFLLSVCKIRLQIPTSSLQNIQGSTWQLFSLSIALIFCVD